MRRVFLFAALLVIFSHALNDNYLIQDYAGLSRASKVFRTFFTILSSPAVPLFLICTGYFFYRRERSIKEILTKNIMPLWVAYAVWVVLNRPLNGYSILADLSAIKAEIFLLSSPWPAYLWYIPVLFGVYLMAPLTRKFVHSLEKKDFYYLFAIVLLVTSADYFALVAKLFGGTDLVLNLGINISAIILLLYPMYGYYFKTLIEDHTENINRDLFLYIFVFVLLFIPQFKLLSNQVGHRVYYYPLGILLSLLTFNILYRMSFPGIVERGLSFVSINSLQYYLAHRFVLYNLNDTFFFVNRPINTVVSFVLGVVIVTGLILFYNGLKKLWASKRNGSLVE